MAILGNRAFFAAPVLNTNPGTLPTYDTSKITPVTRLNSAKLAVSLASGDIAGDDTVDTIEQYASGTLTCTFTELPLETESVWSGASGGDGEGYADGVNNAAPFVGIGYAISMLDDDGTRWWQCVFLPRCRFAPSPLDSSSAGRSLTVGYPQAMFGVYAGGDAAGTWRIRHRAATADEAESWIRAKLGDTA